MSNKQQIRINEEQLKQIVLESVKAVLNEENNEGFLRNMISGVRQANQDKRAAAQPYKQATAQAKQNNRMASQVAKKYGKYIDKDLQSIDSILSHYHDYPQIERSARLIKGALTNLYQQISGNAQNAAQQYNMARQNQQSQRDAWNQQQTQNFRAMFGGQPQQNQYQDTAE